MWFLEIQIQGERTAAFVYTGASRSFMAPSLVEKLKLPTKKWSGGVAFGGELVVRTGVRKAKFRSSDLETWEDRLGAQSPSKILLGTDWLCRESVVRDLGERALIVQGDRRDLELPLVESPAASDQTKAHCHKVKIFEDDSQQADEA